MQDPDKLRWIASVTGGDVVRFEREAGGRSRETYAVDVRTPDGGLLELVLRQDTGGGPMSGTELTLERESLVYRALEGRGLPVPRCYGVFPGADAVLMERAHGTSEFAGDDAERDAVTAHFMEILAALHRIDPFTLELPFPRPATPEEHALLDLDLWERTFVNHVHRPDPLIRFAIGWLRRHAPASVERTVLVHGDTGTGNFLFENGRVTAVLDWEFAHFGDPMDDLAWCCVHDYIQPFSALGAHFEHYAKHAGGQLDRGRLLYYLVFVNLRCAIACRVALGSQSRSMDRATYFWARELFARMMCMALSALTDVPLALPPLPEPDPPTARSALFDTVIGDLTETVLPAVTNPHAARRAQGMMAILLHLQSAERLGRALEEEELDDMASALGARPATVEEGLAAIDKLVADAGPDRDAELLAYLARSSARTMALWAPALGPLASKPLPLPQP